MLVEMSSIYLSISFIGDLSSIRGQSRLLKLRFDKNPVLTRTPRMTLECILASPSTCPFRADSRVRVVVDELYWDEFWDIAAPRSGFPVGLAPILKHDNVSINILV